MNLKQYIRGGRRGKAARDLEKEGLGVDGCGLEGGSEKDEGEDREGARREHAVLLSVSGLGCGQVARPGSQGRAPTGCETPTGIPVFPAWKS